MNFLDLLGQEYEVIKKILKKAKKVTLTMCLNEEEVEVPTIEEEDIFYYNKKCVKQLIEIANKLNIKIEKPILLNKYYRFKNEELHHLAENIYKLPYNKYNEKINNINLFLIANPYNEIENVAKQISNLVRKEEYKYSDIAVITKNLEEYESIIQIIFAKYNIPIFIDRKNELNQNILIKYITGVLEVFAKNWSQEALINYIKSPFIKIEDSYKLENYCVKWGIKGSKWYKQEWEYDEDKIDIQKINKMRKIIVEPLIKLKNNCTKKMDVYWVTKQIYEFLEQNEICKTLNEKIEKLKINGNIYLAEEYKKSFDILIDILDEIVLIFGQNKISFEKYSKILQIGLKYSNLGKIPQLIDGVIVGDVDRTRANKIKALFIVNLNDGIFPSLGTTEGFLNDNDRNILKKNNLEIAKGTLDKLYEDQFNIYKAFTTAEEKLFLSYLISDKNGKSLRPSILISKIKKIFIKLKDQTDLFEKENNIITKEQTFELLLENLRRFKNGEKIDDIWFKIYNWYIQKEEWKNRLENSIKALENNNKIEKLNNNNEILKTSISKLEQYEKCPFSYYLKYELKLQEKNEFKINSIDTGSFMHEVIEEFFGSISIDKLKEEEMEKIVNEIIDNKLNLSKNKIFSLTSKFKLLITRLRKVIIKSIQYIIYQIRNSNFEIVGSEIEFKEKRGNVEITRKN